MVNRELLEKLSKEGKLYENPKPKEWLAKDYCAGKIANYYPQVMTDGEGIRASVYVAGCKFQCFECFNRKIWDFEAGFDYTQEFEDQVIEDLRPSYVQGITFLGGEPFLNTPTLIPLAKRIRFEYGTDKDIWSWSGYTFEELLEESDDKLELLSYVDILVDGRFNVALKDSSLQFRGSSNQRIIDVPESLKEGRMILWKNLRK